MRSSASHPTSTHGHLAQKTVNRAPNAGARGFDKKLARQFVSAVTAPPLVGCDVWSPSPPSSQQEPFIAVITNKKT